MGTDDDVVAHWEVEFDEVDALDGLEGEEGADSAATFSILSPQKLDEIAVGADVFEAVLL